MKKFVFYFKVSMMNDDIILLWNIKVCYNFKTEDKITFRLSDTLSKTVLRKRRQLSLYSHRLIKCIVSNRFY